MLFLRWILELESPDSSYKHHENPEGISNQKEGISNQKEAETSTPFKEGTMS